MGGLVGWLERRFNLTELFSLLTSLGLLPVELDSRKPLREALREALAGPMPSYARWPRVLGILSVFLFLFVAATGLMLSLYYQPTPSEAYGSVTTIVRDVSSGWFVHQVHWWAAQALLLILLVRLWRFFFQGLYRAPREGLWIVALLLFLVAIHADMTGRLLGWSAQGYWTTVRSLEILYELPLLGPILSFLAGGPEVDSLALIRFYFMHVAILPLMLLALFYLGASAVRRVGLSELTGDTASGAAAWRRYLYNLLILAVLILGALVTLATLAPLPFDAIADPFHTPPGSRPPWYLLASHGLMESFPAIVPRWARALVIEAILAVCLLLPFLAPRDTPRNRRLMTAIGIAVLAAWLLFTWHGYRIEAAP